MSWCPWCGVSEPPVYRSDVLLFFSCHPAIMCFLGCAGVLGKSEFTKKISKWDSDILSVCQIIWLRFTLVSSLLLNVSRGDRFIQLSTISGVIRQKLYRRTPLSGISWLRSSRSAHNAIVEKKNHLWLSSLLSDPACWLPTLTSILLMLDTSSSISFVPSASDSDVSLHYSYMK